MIFLLLIYTVIRLLMCLCKCVIISITSIYLKFEVNVKGTMCKFFLIPSLPAQELTTSKPVSTDTKLTVQIS